MEKAIVSIQNAKIWHHWQRESLQENRYKRIVISRGAHALL